MNIGQKWLALVLWLAITGTTVDANASGKHRPQPTSYRDRAQPRLFASQGGGYGLKLIPSTDDDMHATGMLFTIDKQGNDRIIWRQDFSYGPRKVFIFDRAASVITLNTCPKSPTENHAIILYDRHGSIMRKYELAEVLKETPPEFQAETKWWAQDATFNYGLTRGPDGEAFTITMRCGKSVAIDVFTGELSYR